MKICYIAATLALLGGSTANAGTIFEGFIGGSQSRVKVEDCGNDTCGTVSWGKHKFIVKKSDISSFFRDLDVDVKPDSKKSSSKQGDKRPSAADRSKPTDTAPTTNYESRSPEFRRRDVPLESGIDNPTTRNMDNMSPLAATKDAEKKNLGTTRRFGEDGAPSRPDDSHAERPIENPLNSSERTGQAAVAPDTGQQHATAVAPLPSRVDIDPKSPIGEWIVEDNQGRVQIRTCGEALCGVVSSAKNPYETDRHNPDASKRNRPVIGTTVLIDMMPGGKKGRWEGRVYNVKDGRTYSANMSLKSPNTLRIEGCAFGGFLCGGQDWTRADEATN
jgi:uncharacterized protein (DUF2147 family)